MLNIIKNILQKLINDIDSGASVLSEEELFEVLELLLKISRQELSKIEAANYLGISTATFDNRIRARIYPKGHKRPGFKELSWNKYDLESTKTV